MKSFLKKSVKLTTLLVIIVLIISFITFFYRYNYPNAVFWDENYYLASASKYMTGTFFMHDQPPFGQLLIALGEKMIHGDHNFSQFSDVDYVKNFPLDFSVEGYRFFPVFFAWLTPGIFFGVLLLLTKKHIESFLLSLLYLLDNALIVHSRGAMLDGILMFFVTLTILFFLLAIKNINSRWRLAIYSIGMGVSLGLGTTTKFTGLIGFLLIPFFVYKLLPSWPKVRLVIGCIFISFSLIFVLVWQIHFSLGTRINPNLKNSGYYGASSLYKQVIEQKQTNNLLFFPLQLRDSLKYMSNFHKGVPPLNLCKVDENGSPVFWWPLGARAINYRWETQDSGKSYRYLYLQVNPMVWSLGLFGVVSTSGLFFISCFFPLQKPIKDRFFMLVFLCLYWGYMIGISFLNRVMYLYHYFPALLFSLCLFSLWVKEVKYFGNYFLSRRMKFIILAIISSGVLVVYCFYSPLTYYQPLTDAQFRQRMIFPLWNLRCVKCEKTGFIQPIK